MLLVDKALIEKALIAEIGEVTPPQEQEQASVFRWHAAVVTASFEVRFVFVFTLI